MNTDLVEATARKLTTWPGLALAYLVSLPQRVLGTTRRPEPVPPYKTCAGCGHASRDDQQVPDPDQYDTPKKQTRQTSDPAGMPAGDEGEPVNWAAFNADPGAAAERLSKARDRQKLSGGGLKLTDAAPVWCARCRAWFHAKGCYSLHHRH